MIMATKNKRLDSKPCRFVEGFIVSIGTMVFFLCAVLGMVQLVSIIEGFLR